MGTSKQAKQIGGTGGKEGQGGNWKRHVFPGGGPVLFFFDLGVGYTDVFTSDNSLTCTYMSCAFLSILCPV